jgi:hypothetical protein
MLEKKEKLICCLCGNIIEGYGKTISNGLCIEDIESLELKNRIDNGEDGLYVQTDELEGVVILKDGSHYYLEGTEDCIYVTKFAIKNSVNIDLIASKLMETANKEFNGIEKLIDYGNNPAPLKTKSNKDVCCDECNYTKVIPARLGIFNNKN